ncbi:lipase member J-like [Coccinella septempunctata]|uniref:lipase member J-like n=1 Tax=Coccinella septempunctata TaxID=41139 RepID=UPI001D061623|nr:lipase member J-like [Coccinella septempunctata]
MSSNDIFVLLLVSSVPLSQSTIVCPSFKDYFTSRINKNCFDNPDGDAEEPSVIIQRLGFHHKTYQITTEDGYTISVEQMHKTIKRKTPIIIGPGIYMNSLAFINRGNKSLAFFLANQGYQVWIINWRGTRFSRKHSYLSPTDRNYWNMGFHKMAVFDLKSVMEKVFEESKNKGIYIGFSMGTTIGMIFNMKEQEVAERTLKGMIHMAPIAIMDDFKSILRYLNPLWPVVRPLASRLHHGEVLPYRRIRIICGSHPFQVFFCELLILPIFGNSFRFLDPLTYPITSIQNRDSISINTVEHYHQIIKSGQFIEFDFGVEENLEKYNSEQPPVYDLKKMTLPQLMLVGERDIVATRKDTQNLYEKIPEKSKCGYSLVKKYGHREFINAFDVDEILFDKVLSAVEKIDENKCNVNTENK